MATKLAFFALMACICQLTAEPSSDWLDEDYEDQLYGAVNQANGSFTITEVRYAVEEENITLTVCSDDLLEGLMSNETQVFLTLTDTNETGLIANVSGVLDQTGKCATFTELDDGMTLPNTSTVYTVDILMNDGSFFSGSTTFAMTVKTTLLNCSETVFTKVSWDDPTTEAVLLDCAVEPNPLDLVCYHIGDLSNTEFCFTVLNEADLSGENVTVCLKGALNNETSMTSGEEFSIDYLRYGDGSGEEAVLVLASDGAAEAVIVTTDDERSSAYSCSDDACWLSSEFKPSGRHYQVCGELNTMETAIDEFYDVQLTVIAIANYSGQDCSTLQFVFANSLPSKNYSGSLWQSLSPLEDTAIASVQIDCTKVDAGKSCFGFLNVDGFYGESYLRLANAGNETNKVYDSFQTGVMTTSEAPHISEQTTISETPQTSE